MRYGHDPVSHVASTRILEDGHVRSQFLWVVRGFDRFGSDFVYIDLIARTIAHVTHIEFDVVHRQRRIACGHDGQRGCDATGDAILQIVPTKDGSIKELGPVGLSGIQHGGHVLPHGDECAAAVGVFGQTVHIQFRQRSAHCKRAIRIKVVPRKVDDRLVGRQGRRVGDHRKMSIVGVGIPELISIPQGLHGAGIVAGIVGKVQGRAGIIVDNQDVAVGHGGKHTGPGGHMRLIALAPQDNVTLIVAQPRTHGRINRYHERSGGTRFEGNRTGTHIEAGQAGRLVETVPGVQGAQLVGLRLIGHTGHGDFYRLAGAGEDDPKAQAGRVQDNARISRVGEIQAAGAHVQGLCRAVIPIVDLQVLGCAHQCRLDISIRPSGVDLAKQGGSASDMGRSHRRAGSLAIAQVAAFGDGAGGIPLG